MKTFAQRLQQHLFSPLSFSVSVLTASVVLAMGTPMAQAEGQAAASSPATRISAEISSSQMTALPNSKHPLAQAQYDSGRLAAGTKLQGISIYFSRTPAQEADLQTLMTAQQNPSSPLYHQWLNPDQFAARFGMADADIAKVKSWLEQQGFSIDSVGRSKNVIRFSGTAGQAESAFATEMHNYAVKTAKGVETHFAPSTALSVPSALAGVVLGVRNLDDFRPRSHVILNKAARLKPAFTSSQTGNVYFAPGDIATIYDVQKEYNAGFTGAGQSIAIVGQSAIALSDIEAFQSAAALSTKDPTLVLVPGTGSSTVFADGDETESDLDVEWSGAIAKGASIYFVYTGSNTSYGAFDSLQYAIDEQIGTIISSSYGTCEVALQGATLESSLEQAASQGQTVMSASGDDGSTDCFGISGLTTAQQEALAVDYPASSPNVTGLGGTEVSTSNSAYLTAGDGYWEAQGSSDEITSALQYIPEVAWDEDTAGCGQTDCLNAGGGGASILFSKPSWQTSLTPSDGKRDVPDISLNSSPDLPGYLFCTSDQTDWASNQVASCNSGFRDSSSGSLTVAGGTSFAAPIFSGMLALINQQQNYTTGQGLINPTLYTLASNPTTYASAFHDITTGNNDCTAGSGFCSGTIGFSAGTGYDQVTGLGTIDLFNLASAWPANTGASATLIGTTTTISASNSTPALNASVTFTITVASDTGTTIPTGNVSISVDGGTPTTSALTTNGTVTYTTSFTTAGTHELLAAYEGDATHASSSPGSPGVITVTVAGSSSGTGSFGIAATGVTVSQGSTGTSTITVTPKSGYTGTVYLTFDTSNDTALQNLCFEFTNTLSNGDGSLSITGATAATTQLQLDTNAADCATTAAVRKSGKQSLRSVHGVQTAGNPSEKGGIKTAPATIAFAGLFLAGFLGRYSRKFRSVAGVIALVAIGLAVSACGGGSSSNTVSDPPKGTYTITLTGQDSTSATIPTATTTFTLTIQ